ncbi:MAG TPA: MauE/DoxX family redox-associated membrane protein [Jatrophihabitantaceae bacterium]
MDWTRVRPWVGTAARLLLGGIWIWAALSKLRDPLTFTQAVRAYDATPEWLSKAIGYGLPVLELALGVLLILGITVRIAAAISAALFLIFAIGLIQAAARGIKLECGCFGGGGPTDGATQYTWEIIRDLLLLAVAGYLVVWSFTRLSVEEFLARHDHVEQPSAKRMRNTEARRKYEAEVATKQKEARSRSLYLDGTTVLIVVLVTVIGIGVQAGRAKINNVVAGKNATASNGVVFGKTAAATVDVYEDFGCPICKEFENSVATKLDTQVRGNLAQVRFHPISILDGNSPNRYSTRAANAALCVSDVSVDDFVAYHNLLYGSFQPAEGTAGPGSAELTALAKKAGVTGSDSTTVSDCILNEKYTPLVKQLTEKASERGINSTPTVYVNGKKVSATASALFGAITAANVGHTPSPSVTPSPTPSGSSTPVSPSVSPSPSGSKTKKS